MAQDFLDVLFKHCDLTQDQQKFIEEHLFKYRNDTVVKALCEFVTTLLPQFKKFADVCHEADSYLYTRLTDGKSFPLIVLCPTDPTALRIYQYINIMYNSTHESITTTNCNEYFPSILDEYEEDKINHPEIVQTKWAMERFSRYVDMPTAKAITRYLPNTEKPNIIRDFASAIDNIRKPMELSFADTPEDFNLMYATGPHSCMAFTAEGRDQWKFMLDKNICPTSWYAYYPNTRGCYAIKNGKVVARAIIFKDEKDQWKHGRVYQDTPEIGGKFTRSMHENNIPSLENFHKVPNQTTFEVPGININNGIYGCPWPYMDNMDSEARNWGVQYNSTTHIFTFQYKSTSDKFINIYKRGGHLRSDDYITRECSNCNRIIKNNESLFEVVGGDDVLCSDNCAGDLGYIKLIDGTGIIKYSRPSEQQIPILVYPFIRFSTMKAAADNGYYPLVEEVGIYPEDTDIKVTCGKIVSSASGHYYSISTDSNVVSNVPEISPNKVPIYTSPAKKLIEFSTDANLVIELE